jgi:hypothetical protein
MTEREGTPQDFARMLGVKPKGEGGEQPADATDGQEPNPEDASPDAAVFEFPRSLTAAEKLQRDRKLIELLHPPQKDEDE